MTDIVEFLTARLADDEAYALEAAEEFGPDWIEIWSGQIDLSANLPERQPPENRCWDAHVQTNDSRVSRHMVRHDPARVLAEVKAKRAIIERHTSGVIRTYQCGNRDHIQDWQCERAAEPYEETRYCEICDSRDGCVELQELAAVHADHPDYKQEWSVE